MAMRNFWIELEVDGRKHKIATGPRSSGGGFRLVVRQRDHGTSKEVMTVEGVADERGVLSTTAMLTDQNSPNGIGSVTIR